MKLILLAIEASATSFFNRRALLDIESPQQFIHQEASSQIVATGATDASLRPMHCGQIMERYWLREVGQHKQTCSDYCPIKPERCPIWSFAVWIYMIPDVTTCCSVLFDRDSWMHSHSRSHQILPSAPEGHVFGYACQTTDYACMPRWCFLSSRCHPHSQKASMFLLMIGMKSYTK